jgi:epoxyqueuosine reductase
MKYSSKILKEKAIDIGLELKVTRPVDNVEKLKDYIKNNYHASMDWLADRPEIRGNLDNMWEQGLSVLTFSMNYHNLKDPLKRLENTDNGYISCYSLNEDYHDVFKKRLKEYARWLVGQYPESELKVFVDTAPVMERPLAEASGLGWRGKHGCILNREQGGWIFLGEIYTTLDIELDQPVGNHCGSCTKCLDICPTDAFVGEQTIDSNKCVSYLTIEHKGMIAEDLMDKMGNRIYGCDDCIGICPWNRFAQITQEIKYQAREELINPKLEDLIKLNDEEFRKFFSKSPIKRIKRDRFIRNVTIAMGNSANLEYIKTLENLITTETDETIINTAKWSINKLKNTKINPKLNNITVEIA